MQKRRRPRQRRQLSERNASGHHQQDLEEELHAKLQLPQSRLAQPRLLRMPHASRESKKRLKRRRQGFNSVKQRLKSKDRLQQRPRKSQSLGPSTTRLHRKLEQLAPSASLVQQQKPTRKKRTTRRTTLKMASLSPVSSTRAALQRSTQSTGELSAQKPRTRTSSQPPPARSSTWPSRLRTEPRGAAQPACFHTQPKRRRRP
jgi:hypothetical protein